MKLTKNKLFRLPAFTTVLPVAVSFFISQQVFSQRAASDTSCQIAVSSVNNNKKKQICIKESNVVFPDILKGNEEEAMEYIKNFSSNRKAYLVRMYKKGKILLPKTAKILTHLRLHWRLFQIYSLVTLGSFL